VTEITDVERTLDRLIQLGGDRLLARWPGIGALRAIAGDAATAGADRDRYAALVDELRATARAMWGGYGSFTDYGIDGPDADRFERLKDRLSAEIGAL
jgi:hypothetical protein